MNVLILGGDGYLGWPTACKFAALGASVTIVDNYSRRVIAKETDSEALIEGPNLKERVSKFEQVLGHKINVEIGDCCDYSFLSNLIQSTTPDTIIHFAEQPSAPYSMMGRVQAQKTFSNNLNTTFNLVWAVIENVPHAHIVKLGTMGEYGTPNIDIEEGWIDVTHKGRTQKFLYPRQASSLYHTTKVLDTDLLWFYVRLYGLKVTDLMQGPVYGLHTDETSLNEAFLPNFHYDDIFGTVVNRFIVQAVAGVPLTVYGAGGQTRGYLHIRDTVRCIELAVAKPPGQGELRILNQFTEQFSVLELAEKVSSAALAHGIKVQIDNIENPRVELEDHYYNAKHSALVDMGLVPTLMNDETLGDVFEEVINRKSQIKKQRILPRIIWNRQGK